MPEEEKCQRRDGTKDDAPNCESQKLLRTDGRTAHGVFSGLTNGQAALLPSCESDASKIDAPVRIGGCGEGDVRSDVAIRYNRECRRERRWSGDKEF